MKRFLIHILLFFLVVAIIGGAARAAYWLYKTRPRAERVAVETKPTPVKIITVSRQSVSTNVAATGTVMPEQSLNLRAQVTGRVIEMNSHLLPGGIIAKGETIIRIDPSDYELTIEQRKADVERAQFELEVEKGRHLVAQREWDLLQDSVPSTPEGRALALREPHMRNAKAAVAAAESALETAKLNLSRTTISAPYNVLVLEKNVDVGDLADPQTLIAKLVGTDAYWVQAAVPVSKLPYIHIPGVNKGDGSPVRVSHQAGDGYRIEREGKVLRLLGDLDPTGRLAHVLIRVENPLLTNDDAGLPLLLDAYVHVDIQGKTLDNVIVLPREALREGNMAWIMDENDQLAKRDVEIIWREAESVLVSAGLDDGDRVIVGSVPSPTITGKKLRIADDDENLPAEEDL